ncbi:uncharacterized protein LOC104583435 [Brachypodium distachyon]|uniref:Uncharacterized protein n=1 Tax=Brachypodium distachyon TaxID=15368 RepID=I1HXJ0_BRADI|nr:uncharacterized protein LOC104583435 [Brachypodium distachyon]KQJ93476.1 hypothetical protein BRADI_3g04800v3 [Brachypodium distachyon]|eukprot:XP_010233855.1 uncharacterized protein LOC104583435 [Brachypodium distachyon]
MAKAQVAARFVTEVAPPQLVSIVRRRRQHRAPCRSGAAVLDTIAEDDRELQLSAAADAAVAPSPKRPAAASPAGSARTGGGFMRELSGCFSGSNRVVHVVRLPPAAAAAGEV